MEIVVGTGADAGKRFTLKDWPVVVGRDPSCDLVLTDPSVSGRHVQVRLTPSASLEFTDLNSRNGTWIDGHRVTGATMVPPGRAVTVGSSTLFVMGSPVARPAAPATPAHTSPINPFPHPIGQGSYVNAGPMAGGNIAMSGEIVAGKDLYYQEGFRIRSRMRPAARKLLWFGIALFFIGLGVCFVAMAAFNAQIFSEDSLSPSGPSDEVITAFALFFGGMALNLIGIICIVISLVMRRDKVQEPVLARRR